MKLRLNTRSERRTLVRLMLCTVLGILGATTQAADQNPAQPPATIRIATGEWPPYTSDKLNGHGIAGKLITEAFAAVGVTVTYVFYPWNRSLELARRGSIEATATWFESPDRRADFLISDPLFDSNFLLYYRKQKPIDWHTVDDLKGLKIGATTGYFYGDAFARAEKTGSVTVLRASSDEINLKNLLLGRLDAFPLDQRVAEFMFANDLPADDAARITANATPVHSRPQHLLISRKAANGEALMRLFNQGLHAIHRNGLYERIVRDATLTEPGH